MDHEHGEGRYRIGRLAAELDISPKTIRYYEGLGLLHPAARTPAGYRLYTATERDWLRFIIKAKASGLSLREIGAILALRRRGQSPCAHVAATVDQKLAAIEAQLRALGELRDELLALRAEATVASACAGEVCGIIERHAARRPAAPVSAA